MQMGFPETVSDSLCRILCYANRLLQQLSGWLVSDDLGGEDAGSEGSGLVWLHVVCGYEAVGCTAKLSEMPLETAYGREFNIQFTGNSSGGHSCSQHANCTLPQTCEICGIVPCDNIAHLRLVFYCGQPKAHLC